MGELCRVSIDEINHDYEMYSDPELCSKSIRDHKALKVLLLTGWEGRLQEFLEDKYQEFSDLADERDPRRVMDLYLNNNLSEKVMTLVEQEADILASVILG